jgi:hypothetical protein
VIDIDPAVTAHAAHEAMLDAPFHEVSETEHVDGGAGYEPILKWVARARADGDQTASGRYIATHGYACMARDVGITVDELEAQIDAWAKTYDEVYLDALEILHGAT